MTTKARATIEDLYNVPENAKAELVDGELILMSPTGGDPGFAGDEIFVSLREFARKTKIGRAVGDTQPLCTESA
jgi:Uma2 family endonuclease